MGQCEKVKRAGDRQCSRAAIYQVTYQYGWRRHKDPALLPTPLTRAWNACQRCGDRARRHGAKVAARARRNA